MIDEELQEELLKIFDDRFQKYNTEVLKTFGRIIKQFEDLTPSEAHKLAQELKYDTTVKELINELSKLSGKSAEDIKKILEKTAQENIDFAETFYKARGLDVPVYKENKQLQRIVNSVYNITGESFKNISGSTGIKLLGDGGKPLLLDIDSAYKEVIDRCVVAVVEGKETYQQAMKSTIKQLSESGVRKIFYDNEGKRAYSRRLDTTVRMNVLDGMRQVSNESQRLFGEEFDSDGVEISVHLNPAPDHEKVQGHQFSNEEFDNFQNDIRAIDFKGNIFEPEFEGRDRRSISELNCYHYIFAIILGISNPIYSDEELQDIIDKKNETFEFEGKKYNMYEGTQLQRRIETEIRKSKDDQIIALESGNDELVLESQKRISDLTTKYRNLCNESGLNNMLSRRARVSGYRRISVKKLK